MSSFKLHGLALAWDGTRASELLTRASEVSCFDIICSTLATQGKELTTKEFYRCVFPVGGLQEHGEQGRGNAILYSKTADKWKINIVHDGLEELDKAIDKTALIRPISYYGKRAKKEYARDVFAMVFDLDGVRQKQLDNFIYQCQNKIIPTPTLVSASGHGLHLYYLFDEPVRASFKNITVLSEIKHELTPLLWNSHTSEIPTQEQGIFQAFRVIGSKTKIDNINVRGFLWGKNWSIEQLAEYVEGGKVRENNKRGIEYYKVNYPDWYRERVQEGKTAKKWSVNEGFYKAFLKQAKEGVKVGHRYNSIYCLAIVAQKCEIPWEQVKQDAELLQPVYNSLSANEPFTLEEMQDALEVYNDFTLNRTTVKRIEILTGLKFSRSRRNGRTRAEHLKRARALIENHGGNKKQIVANWRAENPNGTKKDCIEQTGLSKPTVYKWWNK